MAHKNLFPQQVSKLVKQGWKFLFLGFVSALISACGGGGVAGAVSTVVGGELAIIPSTVTVYANVPTVFSVSGGKPPYILVSSNAAVLPVPNGNLSGLNNFTLTPNIVSEDTDVTITVRDFDGKTAQAATTVKPNFVNGNLTIKGNSTDLEGGCSDTGLVCSGQYGTVTVTLTQNGAPAKGRSVRFDAYQGGYKFVTNVVQNTLVSTIDVTTDETGTATAVLRADVGAPLQIATIQATDTLSGAFRRSTFFIRQVTLAGTDLKTVPNGWVTGGVLKNTCAFGSVDYLIFGGTPPYTILTDLPGTTGILTAIPNSNMTPTENPSRFTVVYGGGPCGTAGYKATFTITDATGRTITADLENKPGTEEPPAVITLTLSNQAINLACGQQAQVTATLTSTGSQAPTGTVTTSISTPFSPATALTATANGSVVTITRGNGTVAAGNASVVIGATGATPRTVTVTTPLTCP